MQVAEAFMEISVDFYIWNNTSLNS